MKKNIFNSLNKFLIFMLICIIIFSTTSCALFYSKYGENRMPKLNGAFFALSVASVDTVAEWYSVNLGFSIDRKGQLVKDGPKFAILSRPGALIELAQFKNSKSRSSIGFPGAEAQDIYGIFKIGFEIENLDEMYQLAKKRGLNIFFPIVRPQNAPYRTFGIKDPENNIVQFFGE